MFSDAVMFKLIVPFLIFGTLFLAVSFVIDSLRYKLPTVILGLLLSISSVFYMGKKTEFDKNAIEVAKIQIKMQENIIASEKVNTKVVIEYVDKIKVIEKERLVYVDKIREVFTPQIISDYPLPELFVRVHDDNIDGKVPDTSRASDGTPSEITIDEASTYITHNYDICRMNAEKLESLQNWIKQQHNVFSN